MYQFLFTEDNFIVSLVVGLIVLIGGYVLYDMAKVAVKVIGESRDAYQVEYHGDYYQISKTDVKKGN